LIQYGLQHSFYKYRWSYNAWNHGDEATASKHRRLVCCRRDSAAFQAVVFSAQEEFVLTIGSDPLLWKGGAMRTVRCEVETAAPCRIEVKLIGLMEDDDRSLQADVLLEERHVKVPKRRLQAVWIELHADEAAAPGAYQGAVRFYTRTLFEDEVLDATLTFELTIRDHVLPAPQDHAFYLDLWQHNCNIARKYDAAYWSEEHFAVLDSYLHSLGQLGQKAVSVVVSEEPWSGQRTFLDAEPSDLNEYSIVPVVKRKDGSFHYDFSHLDRYVEMAERHGIREEIEVFGLVNIWRQDEAGYGALVEGFPDAIRVRYYDEAERRYAFIRSRQELAAYIQALEAHFLAKGWMDRVRVVADEPDDIALFKERMDCLRAIAPSFAYKAAINHAEFIGEQIEGLVDYVPILNCAAAEYEQLEQMRPFVKGKLAYYVCCAPELPNTFLCSPSIESRIIPWLAEQLGLDGFLRWNYTVWPDHPLERLSYRPSSWKAGDTNFVYPGRMGRPMLSLRYKWLQRGIRDYEYMQQLKAAGKGEQVQRLLEQVFRFKHPAELSPAANKRADELYSLQPDAYDRLYDL